MFSFAARRLSGYYQRPLSLPMSDFVGRVELIVGPMFAGKTTELMRRVKREIHARRNCFVIKYAKDTRYDVGNVASHDRLKLRARAAVSTLQEVGDTWKDFDVLAIDEGQFFPDIVEFCKKVADSGKIVIVSALDGDYQCRPFGRICDLLPQCESVTKLTAVCMMCHMRQASFTRRTVDCSEQELIGGEGMYIATCRECYNSTEPVTPAVIQQVQETIREVEKMCLSLHDSETEAEAAEASTKTETTNNTTTTADSPSTTPGACPARNNATHASAEMKKRGRSGACDEASQSASDEEPASQHAHLESVSQPNTRRALSSHDY